MVRSSGTDALDRNFQRRVEPHDRLLANADEVATASTWGTEWWKAANEDCSPSVGRGG